jgi:hypothetical protein
MSAGLIYSAYFLENSESIFLKVWAAVKQDSINESELATVIKFSVI